jgi:hypothetical protein
MSPDSLSDKDLGTAASSDQIFLHSHDARRTANFDMPQKLFRRLRPRPPTGGRTSTVPWFAVGQRFAHATAAS